MIRTLFTKKKFRWLQRVTGVHRIHHDRWSFGWKFPFTKKCYFEERTYREDMIFRPDYGQMKTWPARWEVCEPGTYHDCTATGRY